MSCHQSAAGGTREAPAASDTNRALQGHRLDRAPSSRRMRDERLASAAQVSSRWSSESDPWAAAGCPNAAQPELSTINRPFLRPHRRIGKQPQAAAGAFSRRVWGGGPANRGRKGQIACRKPPKGGGPRPHGNSGASGGGWGRHAVRSSRFGARAYV